MSPLVNADRSTGDLSTGVLRHSSGYYSVLAVAIKIRPYLAKSLRVAAFSLPPFSPPPSLSLSSSVWPIRGDDKT